jgi:hypothetical protein
VPITTEVVCSNPIFSGVRVTRPLVLCVCFVDRSLSFVLFLLTIVLSVLLRCTDSDYTFGIFQLVLRKYFPDENNATDKDCIFDCVAECFTKTNYSIYYVSLIIIVVIWIPFHPWKNNNIYFISIAYFPLNQLEKNRVNKGNIWSDQQVTGTTYSFI